MTIEMQQRVIRMDLEVWRRYGTFLAVQVTGTGLLAESVDWDVLGIPKADKRRKAFTPGRRYVIPEKWARAVDSTESALRRNADYYHTETGVQWLHYRWISAMAYEAWEAKHIALTKKFYDLRKFILLNWDVLTEETIQFYAQSAYDSWASIRAIEAKMPNLPENERTPGRTEFVHAVVKRANQSMAARRKAVDEQLKVQVYRAVLEDSADLSARIKALDENKLASAGMRADAEIIRKMKMAELEQMKKDLELVGTPIRRMMDQAMARIDESAKSVLAAINKHGYIPGGTAKEARKLNEIYKLFMPQDDESLQDAIDRFEQVLGGGVSKAEVASVQAAEASLKQIIKLTTEAADRVKAEVADTTRSSHIIRV